MFLKLINYILKIFNFFFNKKSDCKLQHNEHVKNSNIHNNKVINNKVNIHKNNKNLLKLYYEKSLKSMNYINDFKFEKTKQHHFKNNYVFEIENIIDDNKCNEIISFFNNNFYNNIIGRINNHQIDITHKNITEFQINDSNKYYYYLQNILLKNIEKYSIKIKKECKNSFIYDILHNKSNYKLTNDWYKIKKYEKEYGYYRWHVDNNYESKMSLLSYIFYLNDVDEGGDTFFYDGIIKCKKGKLVLFPATWSFNHRSVTPLSNDKYIINGTIGCS